MTDIRADEHKTQRIQSLSGTEDLRRTPGPTGPGVQTGVSIAPPLMRRAAYLPIFGTPDEICGKSATFD